MDITNNPYIKTNKGITEKKDKLIVNELKISKSLVVNNLRTETPVITENIVAFDSEGKLIPADISEHASRWEDNANYIQPKGNKAISVPAAKRAAPQVTDTVLTIDENGNIYEAISKESVITADTAIPDTAKTASSITKVIMPNVKAETLTANNVTSESITSENIVLDIESTGTATNGDTIIIQTENGLQPKELDLYSSLQEGNLVSFSDGKLNDAGVAAEDLQRKLTAGYNITIDENNVISCNIETMAFQGSVDTIADLPLDANIGDVYNVTETDKNYCWNGTQWVIIGSSSIDMSNFYTKQEIDSKFDNIIDDEAAHTDKTYSSDKIDSLCSEAETNAKDYTDKVTEDMVNSSSANTFTAAQTFNDLRIPTAQPSELVNGSIWVV